MKHLIRQNGALFLGIANLILIPAVILLHDPLGWIQRGYAGADPLLEWDDGSIKEVQLISPGADSVVRLVRGDKIDNRDGDGSKDRSDDDSPATNDDSKNAQQEDHMTPYRWSVVTEKRNDQGGETTYNGDSERLSSFLGAIKSAKRYYSIPLTDGSRDKYGFALDQSGECSCGKISFVSNEGEKKTLLLGKSSARSNESYVAFEDESRIYEVRENLNAASGMGKEQFFRDRSIFPPEISLSSIVDIIAHPYGKKEVKLSRAGGDWQLVSPVVGPVKDSSINSILNEITGLKAKTFLPGPPSGMSRRLSMDIELVYRKNVTESNSIRLDIMGQTDGGSYILRREDGVIVEFNAVFIEDLRDPKKSLLKPAESTMPFSGTE